MSEQERFPERPLLEEVIDSSPVVVFALRRTEAGLAPIWMCPNVERILGRPPVTQEEPRWWLDAVHPEDRAKVEALRADLERKGSQRFEFRLEDGEGTYRWVREEIRVPDSHEAETADAVGSWSDVTAIRQLQARLLRAGQMEAVGRFVGGVAHEFNNLLTVIRGNADLLRPELPEDSEKGENLEAIQDAAQQAREIVARLLAYTARQSGRIRAVDVEDLLRTEASGLREILGDAVALEIDCPDDLPPVAMDPDHLADILASLAANARDAMEDGGEVRIRAQTRQVGVEDPALPDVPAGEYVALHFRDTGEGMDPRTVERAVDPFFTTRSDPERTGLGLSSVYGMVSRAAGTVQIESTPGEGTAVILYLPVA